jgi:lipoate-protein ligase A
MSARVTDELERDLALLDEVEHGAPPCFRVWTTEEPAVVVGRSVEIAEEVHEAFCAGAGIPIVRRPSGGRSVLVGPGTVQYAFALPYSVAAELASIPGAKRFCNRVLAPAVERAAGLERGAIEEDASGDLLRGGRKVAGLALRRKRSAMLLHGTILAGADLRLIARALKHPKSEPVYRRGRSHDDFLANVGSLDARELERIVRGSPALRSGS